VGIRIHFKNKKKIALVLSGGGVKAAAFHAGVCLALQEKGFRFLGGSREGVESNPDFTHPLAIRSYVGSSAGALMASMLAGGHSLEDVIETFQMGQGLIRRPSRKPKLKPLGYKTMFSFPSPKLGGLFRWFRNSRISLVTGGFETLIKNNFRMNGLFNAKGIEEYLRKSVLPTNSFAELGVEFYSVASYLNYPWKAVFGAVATPSRNPEVNYVSHASISDAVCASLSLPPVFAPWPIKDPEGVTNYFFDGEIRDTLSTHVATDNGADLVIASYSIQPYHFTPEIGSLSDFGLPLILNQALYQVIEQKIIKSIQGREDMRVLITTVSSYFKENGLPAEHGERLVEILSKKVQFRKEVDYIYIHPKPQNYEMFFADHFSLSPPILARIAKIGFKSAINSLRKYDI
jgi:predicted acylesterase/phospholipase RssA